MTTSAPSCRSPLNQSFNSASMNGIDTSVTSAASSSTGKANRTRKRLQHVASARGQIIDSHGRLRRVAELMMPTRL